jgi:hypothetical protein
MGTACIVRFTHFIFVHLSTHHYHLLIIVAEGQVAAALTRRPQYASTSRQICFAQSLYWGVCAPALNAPSTHRH